MRGQLIALRSPTPEVEGVHQSSQRSDLRTGTQMKDPSTVMYVGGGENRMCDVHDQKNTVGSGPDVFVVVWSVLSSATSLKLLSVY